MSAAFFASHSRASDNTINCDKPKKSVGDLADAELKGKRWVFRRGVTAVRI